MKEMIKSLPEKKQHKVAKRFAQMKETTMSKAPKGMTLRDYDKLERMYQKVLTKIVNREEKSAERQRRIGPFPARGQVHSGCVQGNWCLSLAKRCNQKTCLRR